MPRSTSLRSPVDEPSIDLQSGVESPPPAARGGERIPNARNQRAASTRAGPAHASRSAVGYLRRSTDRQEQSIPDQRKAIERYAAEQGIAVERWFTDDAISGTSVAGRRAFQEMIAEAQKPHASRGGPRSWSFVIVYDVKRFGRIDNDEAGYYRHLLKTAPGGGIEVLYVAEGFAAPGVSSETDDLLRPVKQWQARQESKDLSKVTIRGLLTRSEEGCWMGGVPPHGYDLRYEDAAGKCLFILRHMPDGSKQMFDEQGVLTRTLARGESLSISKRDRARLVLGEPSRVECVRRIFRMYTEEGRGLTTISGTLNRDGVPTPRGAAWSRIYCGQWADSTVRAILVNPVYCGDMVWNRRTDGRFHSIVQGRAVERRSVHGARLVPNDEADWITVREAHPAIVSRSVWELARAIREGKPSSELQSGQPRALRVAVGGWNGARSRFILSGLMTCACCGSTYQGVSRSKGRPKKDGTTIKTYSYGCGGYIAKGTSVCQFHPVDQVLFERAVGEAVLSYYARYEGNEGHALLLRTAREHLGIESRDLAAAIERVRGERTELDGRIANLLDHISATTRDLVEVRLAELRPQREQLLAREGELERLAQEQLEVQDIAHEVARFVAGLSFTLQRGEAEEKKIALRRCIDRIHVDKPKGAAVIRLRRLPNISPTGGAVDEVVIRLPEVTSRPRSSQRGLNPLCGQTTEADPPAIA